MATTTGKAGSSTERTLGHQRFLQALSQHGYQCAWQAQERTFEIEGYVGGKLGVVIVQRFYDGNGFEAYAPLTTSNKVDDTIAALDANPKLAERVKEVTDQRESLRAERDAARAADAMQVKHTVAMQAERDMALSWISIARQRGIEAADREMRENMGWNAPGVSHG